MTASLLTSFEWYQLALNQLLAKRKSYLRLKATSGCRMSSAVDGMEKDATSWLRSLRPCEASQVSLNGVPSFSVLAKAME
jgi:hypothetical protein